MSDKVKDMKVEITQDKLVDLLLHAATREDISSLRQEVSGRIDRLESKVDSNFKSIAILVIASILVPILIKLFWG